jgi:multiple sugar transport system substrate-binding protein
MGTGRSLEDLLVARPNRRQVLRGALGAGAGLVGLGAFLEACGQSTGGGAGSRPLTPTFYQWITDEHPAVQQLNQTYGKQHPLHAETAPVQGFGITRFVAEAKKKSSTWDVYVGMTPFVEMGQLVAAGVIEPWDAYMPKQVLDDIIPSIRDESTYQGKVYDWPFLLDITVAGWNAQQVEKAGLDPEAPPKTWDEYIANAQKVKSSGAAPFGCTFDAHGWRSLAPITYSISTDVYDDQGLFQFTSPAAVEALQIMRRMKELANPDVLNPGTTDAGVNGTPDEGAFTARQAAYYVKYENAPIRMAAKWPDPGQLRLGALPSVPGGAGATVFWDTGSALFTYGTNKQQAADYLTC